MCAVIVIGVKLVKPLAMAGTAMPPLAAAGRGLTRRSPYCHSIGGTRLTRRDEGITPLMLTGQGERRETRHWHWQDMPTWAVPPMGPAAHLSGIISRNGMQLGNV